MNTLPTIEPNWLEEKQPYRKQRAIRELTANCPCAGCPDTDRCKQQDPGTAVGCKTFRDWTQRG